MLRFNEGYYASNVVLSKQITNGGFLGRLGKTEASTGRVSDAIAFDGSTRQLTLQVLSLFVSLHLLDAFLFILESLELHLGRAILLALRCFDQLVSFGGALPGFEVQVVQLFQEVQPYFFANTFVKAYVRLLLFVLN